MKAEIVSATPQHAAHIAANIREPDRLEIWSSTMVTPERAMLSGMNYSDFALTGLVDGEPVCMWGVVQESLIGNVGVPWMLGSSALDRVAMTFLRRCKAPLMEALRKYDRLVNYVDARNTRTIRWLRWMGFEVEAEPVAYGVFNLPFHKFEWRK